jgi:hypothetical protein
MSRERELAELETMRGVDRDGLRAHRALWKERRAWTTHLASTGMTMLLLGTINVITGASFPWALFPIGAMGIGLFMHYGRFKRRLSELGGRLGIGARRPSSRRRGTPESAFLRQARAVQAQIEREIDSLPESTSILGEDFRDVLSTYVDRLDNLDRTQREIRELIAGIPMSDLASEKRRLESKIERGGDSRAVAEIRNALEQIERQRRSHAELSAELELIDVRATSALHALNQLKIDLVRTRNTHDRSDSADDLRARSEEISRYLADLRAGYDELE